MKSSQPSQVAEDVNRLDQNSEMTLAMPTVENENSMQQTASKLIKIDENLPQVKKELLNADKATFGHTETTFKQKLESQEHARRQACNSQLNSMI